MPLIPDFEHNGISINHNEPLPPLGPPGHNVIGIVGTAPDLAAGYQLNTAIRIAGPQDHKIIDSTGDELGSLIQTLKKTHEKTAVPIWVVVVEAGADVAATKANIIGSASPARTGIHVLSECLERPNIIGAPGYSSAKEVIDALAVMGKRLRARVVVDGPATTTAAAVALSDSLGGENTGHDRVLIVDPAVSIYSRAEKGYITVPGSVVALGALAAVKQWESWQNQGVLIGGTSRAIEYNIEDKTTEADLLNKNGVTAICHTSMGGYSIIGNRTVTGRFVSHVGLEDVIARKLSETSQPYAGKNLTEGFINQVLRRLNNFLQDLRREGALIDAKVSLHPTLNSVGNYTAGKWFVQMSYGRYSPAEHTVFELSPDNDIIESFLEGLING